MPANLEQLIEQLPATDRELELQKLAAQPADPAKPPPKADRPGTGSKFTGPAPADAWTLCDQVLAGGRAEIIALIRLIRDPGADDFKNYKAEYLLHCLALRVSQPDQTARRPMLADAIASQLDNETLPIHTRGFLVRELEWIGDDTAVAALARLLTHERLCHDAVRTLLSIGGNRGTEQIRRAFPGARGPARLALVQALGSARDPLSRQTLEQALTDPDVDVRLAAAHGLARIGDTASVDPLLKLAEAPAGWERIKATAACFLLAENLAGAGQKVPARKIYSNLRQTRTGPKERHFREAADRGLTSLA